MSNLSDKVAMRHMDVYMEQEEKYTEAVMSDTERLQAKLQSEMASRFAFDLSTPPLRWGPWYVMSFVFFFFYFLLGFVFIFTIYVDPSCLIPLRWYVIISLVFWWHLVLYEWCVSMDGTYVTFNGHIIYKIDLYVDDFT